MLPPTSQESSQRRMGIRAGAVVMGAVLSLGGAIALPSVAQTETVSPAPADARFACQYIDGEYVVMYYPQSQPGESYPWAKPTTLGGGWTPERRCTEISRRLESYRPDGLLEMRTSVENDYDIVCVTTQQNSDCRIVLTVPPGQDARVTRDRVFESLTVADSGQQTDAVTTFTGNDRNVLGDLANELNLPSIPGINMPSRRSSDAINLRPFLDPSDGGTGNQLVPSNAPSLNPDRFR